MKILDKIDIIVSLLFTVLLIAGGITLILTSINPNINWKHFLNIYLGSFLIIFAYKELKLIIQ